MTHSSYYTSIHPMINSTEFYSLNIYFFCCIKNTIFYYDLLNTKWSEKIETNDQCAFWF